MALKIDLAGHLAKYGQAIDNARCFSQYRFIVDQHGVKERVGEEAYKGIERLANQIRAIADNERVMLAGNGGSLSACQHIANDLMLANVQAWALADSVALTCAANDYTYAMSILQPLRWAKVTRGDIVILLSTSGESENVLTPARWLRDQKIPLVTFSGGSDRNELCAIGDINFVVGSSDIGRVQIAHEALLHTLVDLLAGKI